MPAHPSPLRVAPVQFETTISYIQRLAARHHLSAAQLLSALGIPRPLAHDACTRPHGPRTASELYLNAAARHRIAAFCGIHEEHLAHALPTWTRYLDRSPDESPTARVRLSQLHAVTGCPHCTLARTGNSHPVAQYLPDTRIVCRRHRIWMLGLHTLNGVPFPAEHADLTRTPEILTAHQAHIRLLRRGKEAAEHGLAHAAALTEHWRCTAPADELIWPARARRIHPAHTCLWYALAREPLTYPETIALAQLFTRHPHTLRTYAPPGGPHPLHATIAALLERPWLEDPAHYPPRLPGLTGHTCGRHPHPQQPHRHALCCKGPVELTELGYHPPTGPPRQREQGRREGPEDRTGSKTQSRSNTPPVLRSPVR